MITVDTQIIDRQTFVNLLWQDAPRSGWFGRLWSTEQTTQPSCTTIGSVAKFMDTHGFYALRSVLSDLFSYSKLDTHPDAKRLSLYVTTRNQWGSSLYLLCQHIYKYVFNSPIITTDHEAQQIMKELMIPRFNGSHTKVFSDSPSNYPARHFVLPDQIRWTAEVASYTPQSFTHRAVLENDRTKKTGGWADPEDFTQMKDKTFTSYQTPTLQFDKEGKPLNPMGRTGLQGRGLLGKYGANFAADPIVWRLNPSTQELEFLLVKRQDCGQWAIPGGMVDEGEAVSQTLQREFNEEASDGHPVHLTEDAIVYKGYVDDPRNTDHAWMETTVAVLHLEDSSFAPKAGDDATHAEWTAASAANLANLYASHPLFLRLAVQHLEEQGLISDAANRLEALGFAYS